VDGAPEILLTLDMKTRYKIAAEVVERLDGPGYEFSSHRNRTIAGYRQTSGYEYYNRSRRNLLPDGVSNGKYGHGDQKLENSGVAGTLESFQWKLF